MRSPVRSSVRVSLTYLAISAVVFCYAFADAGTVPPSTSDTSFAVVWASFLHTFNIVAPWLVLAGLPSIITALTAYPKAGGVVKVLKTVLNVLSVLTHHDSPGTMKSPLTMSKPPTDVATSLVVNRVALLLPFFIPLLFLHTGCGTLSLSTRAFGTAYGQCMKDKGLAVVPAVEQAGLSILAGGTSQQGVVDDLEALAGRATVDGVTCLVSSWLSQRGTALNPSGVAGGNEFLRRHAALKSKVETINRTRG